MINSITLGVKWTILDVILSSFRINYTSQTTQNMKLEFIHDRYFRSTITHGANIKDDIYYWNNMKNNVKKLLLFSCCYQVKQTLRFIFDVRRYVHVNFITHLQGEQISYEIT